MHPQQPRNQLHLQTFSVVPGTPQLSPVAGPPHLEPFTLGPCTPVSTNLESPTWPQLHRFKHNSQCTAFPPANKECSASLKLRTRRKPLPVTRPYTTPSFRLILPARYIYDDWKPTSFKNELFFDCHALSKQALSETYTSLTRRTIDDIEKAALRDEMNPPPQPFLADLLVPPQRQPTLADLLAGLVDSSSQPSTSQADQPSTSHQTLSTNIHQFARELAVS